MIINFNKKTSFYLINFTEFSAFKCSYYDEILKKWIIENATNALETTNQLQCSYSRFGKFMVIGLYAVPFKIKVIIN